MHIDISSTEYKWSSLECMKANMIICLPLGIDTNACPPTPQRNYRQVVAALIFFFRVSQNPTSNDTTNYLGISQDLCDVDRYLVFYLLFSLVNMIFLFSLVFINEFCQHYHSNIKNCAARQLRVLYIYINIQNIVEISQFPSSKSELEYHRIVVTQNRNANCNEKLCYIALISCLTYKRNLSQYSLNIMYINRQCQFPN